LLIGGISLSHITLLYLKIYRNIHENSSDISYPADPLLQYGESQVKTMNQLEQYNAVEQRVKEVMPVLPYHNTLHAQDVAVTAGWLGLLSGLDTDACFDLSLSGQLHDIDPKSEDNSAAYAEQYLPTLGLPQWRAQRIGNGIRATKTKPTFQNPTTLFEKVLCDADVYNFARDDFMAKAELIRQERQLPDAADYWKGLYELMQRHSFHTEAANLEGNIGKLVNIELLEQKIKSYGSYR
jgi:predicted metal-dependent HD superfamily phosphohydrolase